MKREENILGLGQRNPSGLPNDADASVVTGGVGDVTMNNANENNVLTESDHERLGTTLPPVDPPQKWPAPPPAPPPSMAAAQDNEELHDQSLPVPPQNAPPPLNTEAAAHEMESHAAQGDFLNNPSSGSIGTVDGAPMSMRDAQVVMENLSSRAAPDYHRDTLSTDSPSNAPYFDQAPPSAPPTASTRTDGEVGGSGRHHPSSEGKMERASALGSGDGESLPKDEGGSFHASMPALHHDGSANMPASTEGLQHERYISHQDTSYSEPYGAGNGMSAFHGHHANHHLSTHPSMMRSAYMSPSVHHPLHVSSTSYVTGMMPSSQGKAGDGTEYAPSASMHHTHPSSLKSTTEGMNDHGYAFASSTLGNSSNANASVPNSSNT